MGALSLCPPRAAANLPTRSRFRDFTRDGRQMALLFENFVRNFYRQHTKSKYRVHREDIRWNLSPRDPSDCQAPAEDADRH